MSLCPVRAEHGDSVHELPDEVLYPGVALHGAVDGEAVLELAANRVSIPQVHGAFAIGDPHAQLTGVGQPAIPAFSKLRLNRLNM